MNLRDQFLEVQKCMGQAIIGQETVLERLMIALLANGNVLMEGLPGTAKTRSIKTLPFASRAIIRRSSTVSWPMIARLMHFCTSRN